MTTFHTIHFKSTIRIGEYAMKRFIFDPEIGISISMLTGLTQPFQQHYHDYYTIGFSLKGVRDLLTCYAQKSARHTFNEGTFMLLNPFEVHQCCEISAEYTTYYSIAVPPHVINKYTTIAKNQFLMFSNQIITDELLANKFLNFIHLSFKNQHKYFDKKALFLDLIDEIIIKYTVPKTIMPPKNLITALARHYMNNNFNKHFTIEEMCKTLNIKPSTLFLHFNKEFGITPQKYLTNIRIMAAKKLLKLPVPISQAALIVGFYDHSHLTNICKKLEGITPEEYCHAFHPNNK